MIIESKSKKVEINAPKSILNKLIKDPFTWGYIPCSKMGNGKADAKINVNYGNFDYQFNFPEINYNNSHIYPRDLVVNAELLLERLRQESGIYSMHSNTVQVENKGIVIFGPPHVGKTTLSLLAAKNLRGKVIANERSLIDSEKQTVSGSVRNLKINSFTKEYIKNSNGLIGEANNLEIAMFVHPYLTEDISKYGYTQYEKDAAIWDSEDQIATFIRAINRRIHMGENGQFMISSFDTSELANKRILGIEKIVNKIPFYIIKGDYEEIINQIRKLL